MEGIRALKASQAVQNYDVNTMTSPQEMRPFVCGRCHVTYYVQLSHKRLTFPWAKGLKVEDIIAVEDVAKIKEWDHPDSGAGLIKARHPEFGMCNQGVHARSGVVSGMSKNCASESVPIWQSEMRIRLATPGMQRTKTSCAKSSAPDRHCLCIYLQTLH